MNTIECAYPEEPILEGKSNAWRIRGTDNATYIVKFHLDGDQTALNELICACLAKHFGLPSLEPFLVWLYAEHVEQINVQRSLINRPPVAAGPHFGVRYVSSFLTAESLSIKLGRKIAARDISNLDSVPDILGFDTLVQNNDRHCNNVGVKPEGLGSQYSYRVFDFNLAFGGRKWSARQLSGMYSNLQPIMQFCLVVSAIKSKDDFARFIRTFETSLAQGVDSALDEIPPEWGPSARADAEDLKAAMVGLGSGALTDAIMKNRSLQVTP